MPRAVLSRQVQNHNVWVRNAIECPIQEYIRHLTEYKHSAVLGYGEEHDSLLHVLYPNAKYDVQMEWGGIVGKADAVINDTVIEHKRISTPIHPMLVSTQVIEAIVNGVKEIVSSMLPVTISLNKTESIYDSVKPRCIDKYPYTIGCIPRAYFGVEISAKKFYEHTHRFVSEYIFELSPSEYIDLVNAILYEGKYPNERRIEHSIVSMAVGHTQVIVYSFILWLTEKKAYNPKLSISVVPKSRMLPIINIEYDLSGFGAMWRDNEKGAIEWLETLKKMSLKPRDFKYKDIAQYKHKPCRMCDLRAVCPFRKYLEEYDKDVVEKDKYIVRQFKDYIDDSGGKVVLMNPP